jgi:hypothetical protein
MSIETKGLKFLVRALDSANFRLFFFGQAVSLIGTWMQLIAMRWLVYRLTKSSVGNRTDPRPTRAVSRTGRARHDGNCGCCGPEARGERRRAHLPFRTRVYSHPSFRRRSLAKAGHPGSGSGAAFDKNSRDARWSSRSLLKRCDQSVPLTAYFTALTNE